MKKKKFRFEQTTRAFNVLLPEEYKEPWKNAVSACKDEIEVDEDQCDFALSMVRCFHSNNPKYTFA